MPLQPGVLLGPYEIRSLLGAGGMGEVYRAHDTRLGRDVAVKVLSERWAEDADARARFEREARAVAALSHPNIVGIHDVGHGQGRSWAVTELLQGETLGERLAHRRLERVEALELAQQMIAGVAAAHSAGLVHRDLKPANLFLVDDRSGGQGSRLKILDFGLAKSLDLGGGSQEDATLQAPTAPGIVLGTVGYMSPEQAQGLPTDARTDVFALGAILFEMLTGQRAFAGPSGVAILSAILRDQPDTSSIPAPVRAVVARCLAKRPEERYASAVELGAALAAVLSTATGPALAAVAEADLSIAVLPLTNTSPDSETEYFSDGVTEEIINALSQVPRLRVAARTSSFYFKGRHDSLRDIAQTLGVRSLLEGSVRRAGNRVRITIQLVSADDGYQLWSERYDRTLDDVFAVQDEIASAVARRLRGTLSGDAAGAAVTSPSSSSSASGGTTPGSGSGAASAPAPTPDPEAYDLYLRGRYLAEQRQLTDAIACFDRAIERDPGFVLAHVGLSASLVFLGFMATAPSREVMPRARAAAERALALDPRQAQAYYALGMVAWLFEWNAARAEELFRRGLELEPHQSELHMGYAFLLAATLGRFDEAIDHARAARAIDPVNPTRVAYHSMMLQHAGRFDEAVAVLADTAEREPHHYLTQRLYGLACHGAGRLEEAAAATERALAASNRHYWTVGELALIRLDQGRRDEALELLGELQRKAVELSTPSCFPAILLYRLGDLDGAVAALEQALECRDSTLALTWWPAFEPFHREPRLRAVIERVGLGTRLQPRAAG